MNHGDFDYRYKIKDCLARRNPEVEIIFLFMKLFVMIFMKFGENVILPYLVLTFNAFRFIFQQTNHPFSDYKIQ